MKKFSLLFLAILLASLSLANAQSPLCQWAQKISGNGSDGANSIAVDANGNIYVAGFYLSDTLSFNNGISLTNGGAYIAKYNASGVCQWAQKIVGNSGIDANCIAVDASGNIYVSGGFQSDTLSFNNGISLTNIGSCDAYIAKYNSSGECQWAQKIAGTHYDYANSIALDASGNVYVAGCFYSDTLSFNNGISLANISDTNYYSDGYITKYNSSGECQWAQRIAGTNDDQSNSIVVDASGNVYVAGDFQSSTLSFNNSISLTNSKYYTDGYIAKYNSSGECQWAQNIAGNYDDRAMSIVVDASGNVCVVGYFKSSTLSFNNGISLTNSGGLDSYIAKYNSSGECQWAQKVAGTDEDGATSIAVSGSGKVYVAGYFQSSTLSFNNSISLTNSGGLDSYIAEYNSSGICQWAQKIGETNDEWASSIAVDASGNIYVAGSYKSDTLILNNGISLTNSGSQDAYIAKYKTNGANGVAETPKAKLNIYPNPTSGAATITYNAIANSSAKLMLMDAKGALIKTIDLGVLQIGENTATISTDGLASGVYTIIINAGNETITGFITVAK